MDQNAPTFNLKAVVRETGLKPDTLRAWERRYGVPEPNRTPGGHRLYSHEDIVILKWLLERQDEGMSISRAVELYRRLRAEGKQPTVSAPVENGHRSEPTGGDRPVPFHTHTHTLAYGDGEAITATRKAWINACLDFDEQKAEGVLAQAFALYPTEAVCVEVLMKGLGYLGEGWYQGQVTAQQEHFASSLAMRRLEALLAATPPPTRRERVLIACPPEEEHTFVPLMLALMLRRQGLDVIYLGADVPLAALEETLASARPNLVIMTAQQLHTAANLLEMARLLQEYRIPGAYGGLVFAQQPTICQRIPAHYLGARLDVAPQMVEQILRMPYALPQTLTTPELAPILAEFRQRRPAIEARLWQSMQAAGIPPAQLKNAVLNMSRNLESALLLGDLYLMGNNIDWVQGLLVNHRVPVAALALFLEQYGQALVTEMAQSHPPISGWFDGILGRREARRLGD